MNYVIYTHYNIETITAPKRLFFYNIETITTLERLFDVNNS